MRAQSAMEFLVNYGWAFLAIAVALALFFGFGLFNPNSILGSACALPSPAQLSCIGSSLNTSGNFIVNIRQNNAYAINITAIGCNTQGSSANVRLLTPQVKIAPSANATIALACYSNNNLFKSKIGGVFKGYLIVNYTDSRTNLPQELIGTVIEKVSHA